MNSVKPVSDNIESLSDNVKKDVVLYDDSRLDRNKNKLILYNFNSYKKILKDSLDLNLNNDFLLNNVHP